MPDRDFLPQSIPRGWRSCARLWRDDGLSDAVVDLARRALAQSLRSNDYAMREAEQEARRREGNGAELEYAALCELTLAKALLAPLRPARLERVSYFELDGDEAHLREALRGDISHYAGQLAEGKQVRARAVRRPDTRQFLDTPVAVRLP